MLKPGDTIGILGGGQLGRMIALSCAQLGLKTHILCPEADSPAFQVSDGHICAAYDDEAALAELARIADVVTYEFENVPLATAQFLSARVPVRPGPARWKSRRTGWRKRPSCRRSVSTPRPSPPWTALLISKRPWRRSACRRC